MFYIGKITFLTATKFVPFKLFLWFSGVLASSMEMNRMENHCKRKKNRKGNEDTNIMHDMHENISVYLC